MKKWLLRIGLGFLGVLVLLYAVLMVRSSLPATVHDQELQLVRARIPAGFNAFDALQTAKSQFWWPKNQGDQIYDLVRDTNWDAALASTVLASNREMLASWDAAANMPAFQVPAIRSFDDDMSYLADWKRLTQVAQVRENVLLHNGQDKEAFDQIVNHIQLGRRMQNAQGPLIQYLVGLAVCNLGLNQMQRWVGRTDLTPGQLKDYLRQLEPNPDEEAAAFANTIKAEYQCQSKVLDDLRRGKVRDSETSGYYHRPTRWLPVFNYSQTKALCANFNLKLIQAAAHHYYEAKVTDLESRPSLAAMYLSGNAVGQILFYMTLPAMTSSLATKSKGNAQLQATRTILALRAYQLTHGHLPADLNALVPEFMEAVPIDDFDGQPLRYAPDRKTVYSVGKNLKDDGGDDRGSDTEPASQRHLDLVYKFDF